MLWAVFVGFVGLPQKDLIRVDLLQLFLNMISAQKNKQPQAELLTFMLDVRNLSNKRERKLDLLYRFSPRGVAYI